MQAPRANPARSVNIDEQGMINGQSTFEHEIGNAYKDDEKPWKKPGLLFEWPCLNDEGLI